MSTSFGGISFTLVSIVVPCHNEESTVERCLNAIITTKTPSSVNTEVIVINDRSTDKSVEIIRELPVKLINKYQSDARNPYAETLNVGIKQASGEYIAIIDSDIEVERDWLVKLLPHFMDKKVGTVSGYIIVSPGKSWVNNLYYSMHLRTLLSALKRREKFRQEVFPKSGFYIFRREVFEVIGLFDESIYATDIMLNLKLRIHGYTQICDMTAIAHDIRQYTSRKLIKTCIRRGTAVYQTGGSLLYLHQELLFRYVFLAPYYCISLFRAGRSFVSLLFPVYALTRYFCSILGYAMAAIRKEERCAYDLRKKRRENEIKWMLSSFKKEIGRGLRLLRG